MRIRMLIVLAGAALALIPAVAQAATSSNVTTGSYSFGSFSYQSSCPGAELVTFPSGTETYRIDSSRAANGSIHFTEHFQFTARDGVGQSTGATYLINSPTTVVYESGQFSSERTIVESFHLIGQGPNNNQSGHVVVHMTFEGNGQPVNSTYQLDSSCQ